MARFSKNFYFASMACLFSVWVSTSPTALAESGNFSLSYSGRLTQADGAPLSGPVDVSVKFWSAPDGGNALGSPIELTNIALIQGVFTIPLDLNPAQVTAVFGQGSDPVFIEITAAGKTYPRQQYSFVPFALRVPVDGKTVAFDGDGKLGLSLTSQPSANQFLTKDANGRLTWGSPVVSTLQGQSIASTAPTSGQILTYSGGQWVPQTLAVAGAAGGTVTNVSATAPLNVTSGTTTPVISMAQASGSANGYLSSADWTMFNSKPGAAVTSVSTGTGLSGGPITSTGTISLSNTAVTPGSYTRANITVDAQGRLTAATNGASVNLASEVSGTLPVGSGGTGATSFTNNGILVGSGSLPVSTVTGSQYQVLTASAGGTPNFGSINLDQSAAVTGILPRANGGTGVNSTATFPGSGVIVTEGATETLTNKTLTGATIDGASSIGGATAINTTGTVNSGAQAVAGNVTILGNNTTANKLVLNDKGSTNSVALKAPDTLASSLTLELPSSSGSNGQVLATNGSGILSWVSAATGSVTNVTGTSPISVSTGNSTPVISMPQATGITNGYLSSADWNTFNGKQAAGNYLTGLTGDVTATGPGSSAATLAAVAIAGTSTKVSYDVKGRVTSGTSLEASDLPSHSAALITSGTLAVANGGTGSNLSSSGGTGQYLKQTTSGGSVTVGTIAASDITSSLGYTPLNKAGDTITGALNLSANDLINAGNIQMAASKTLALSTNSADPSGLAAGDVGKTWFNSTTNQIKYWNGSAAVALGAAGSGLSNLNGQTGNTQTFAVPGTSGTAPAWSSASNVHSLNIPMASAASVTAGLLSNADYLTFNSKQAAGNYVTTLTGDVTTSGFSAGSATATLASVSPGGTSTKVTFDTKGRVTSGTTLSASDIPPLSAATITSGTLTVANGGTGATTLATNNVILGNGTNAVQVVAPGTNGNVLTSNGTTWQSTALPASVTSVTGTAPISVANGTSTPVISLAQANNNTNGYLSSADWTTFNSKQAAGSYISALTGDVTATGPGSSAATLAAVAIAGTSTKVTYDVKGRVTSGTSLTAADLPSHSAALITAGTLAVANGGTGLSAAPTNGQIPIGNGTGYTLATITGSTGITVTNSAGGISVASSVDPATKLNKSGDVMTGALQLPTNGLVAGTSQLVLANGNVGIGTTSPQSALDVSGSIVLSDGNAFATNKYYSGGWKYKANGWGGHMQYFNTGGFGLFVNAQNSSGTGVAVADIQALMVNPNGNVGIGTTNPLTLLETTGAIHAHDASQGPDNGYNGLIRVTRAPASGQYINLTRNGNVVWSLGTVYNSNTFAIGVGQVTDSAFTAPTLSINTAGNVGIGTTAPSNALEVAGSIKSTSGGYKFPDGTTQTTSAGITGCPSGMTMVPADPSNGFVAYCIDSSNTTGVGANDAQIACQNAGKHMCRAQELYRASAAIAVSCATAIWNGDGLTFWNGAQNFANYTSGASCSSNGWAPMSNTYPYRCCR